jgi:hypothetical protein
MEMYKLRIIRKERENQTQCEHTVPERYGTVSI